MMRLREVFRIFLLVLFVECAQSHETPCTGGDDMECLQEVREFLERTDFWFGDDGSTPCPSDDTAPNLACHNFDVSYKSVISRFLGVQNFNVNKITQVLRIRYSVPAGRYVACGHVVNVPAISMDIDHLHTTHIDQWSLAHRPAIIWDHEPHTLYTVVAYDVGHMVMKGLWININGGDWSLGQELFIYEGPRNAQYRTDVYVFGLFKQTKVITDHGDFKPAINRLIQQNKSRLPMNNLTTVIEEITDPMAVGIIITEVDTFGVHRYNTWNILNSCPLLIYKMRPDLEKIAAVHKLADLGSDVAKLDVQVEVTYISEAIDYEACCHNRSEPSMKIKVDPLSGNPIDPVFLRKEPYVRFDAVNKLDTMFFYGKIYTILLLDVTHATMTPGTQMTSLLWHVNDIKGQYVTSGMTQMDYIMPNPPLNRANGSLYTFFVFQQNDTIGNVSMGSYCSGDSGCNFDLHNYIKDHNLHLSGVNWFWARPDLYTRMKMYEDDHTKMDMACHGVQWYGNPCPDKCLPPPAMPTPTTVKQATKAPSTPKSTKTTGDPGSGNQLSSSFLLIASTLVFKLFVR